MKKRSRNQRFTCAEIKQMLSKYEWIKDFERLLKEYYSWGDLTQSQYFMLSSDASRLRKNLACVIAINSDKDSYDKE